VSIGGNAQPAQTPGGTHSGSVTVVREIMGNDNSFPNDDLLLQYEATYLFDTATANVPAAMPRGLITRSVPGPEASDNFLCDHWWNRALRWSQTVDQSC
jgi:hypothetical protein